MPSYDPTNFYCEAVDKKGHGRQVRIHPESHGQIAALLSDPALPYRTYDDFVRDAVVHRLHWLEENKDNEQLRTESKRLLAQATLDRQARIVDAEKALVMALRDTVNTPERRIYLTQEQITDTLASLTTPSLRDEAERIVAGFSF